MFRSTSHKWWTRALALQLALVLAGTLITAPFAKADGKYDLADMPSGGGGGGGVSSGDPDVPTAPSARSGARTDGTIISTEQIGISSVDGDSAWVIRLRFVMQSLRAFALRF